MFLKPQGDRLHGLYMPSDEFIPHQLHVRHHNIVEDNVVDDKLAVIVVSFYQW